MGHHGLKTGLKHLFEHPKWSRNQFEKKICTIFGPTYDPCNPTLARALRALNTTLSCQNGALKGDDNVGKA